MKRSAIKRKSYPKRSTKPIKRRRTGESVGALRNTLWDLVSKYVRQKAADENGNVKCVTCDWVGPWKEAHAGHFISGRSNLGYALMFDLRGIHPQCECCNVDKRGNYPAYLSYMMIEYGEEVIAELRALKQTITKITGAEIQEQIREYRTKLDLMVYR